MASVETFTFVCLAPKQEATHVDIQALTRDAVRAHAFGLLREHASAETIEVWREDAIVAAIDRDGVRTWPPVLDPSRTPMAADEARQDQSS